MPLPSPILLGTPHDIEPGDLWRKNGSRWFRAGSVTETDSRDYLQAARDQYDSYRDPRVRDAHGLVEIVRGAA